ncbi:hypothetical protein J4E93_000989 [Alternaria ventricosa]|uniref:uncharacterized protein n=1 Tax=Alternaria ventricosa TaxID=1187951 RepID=UPI0020C56C79|nr:uncharacterized protein J4E93_000989 [Alternaria ventricosa]KAI4656270.1 hypothetical protein J4E93_000989 [Alternaria ventricosa]
MSFHLLSQAMHAKKPPAARSTTGYGSYDKYTYRLPSTEELANSTIVLEINRGPNGWERKRIEPVNVLSRPIEDYLPPPGCYYDMMQIDKVFGNNLMKKRNKCMSCWKPKHVDSPRECDQECAICQTGDHVGDGCHALYMPMVLWELLGYRPPHGDQVRPEAAEQVYLVLAGIIMPQENKTWPIRPNMDHPLVREFYEGRDYPEPLLKKAIIGARTPKTSDSRVKLITTPAATVNETEAAPVLATALPTTGAASVEFPPPNIAKPYTAAKGSIEQEQEEEPRALQEVVEDESVADEQVLPPTTVEQLREVIAEKDAKLVEQGKELEEAKNRIRELEKVVANVRSSIANESNKRARC